jgi:hypothetical protein
MAAVKSPLIIRRFGNTGMYSPVLPVSGGVSAPINQSLGRSIAEVPFPQVKESPADASTTVSSPIPLAESED